MEWPLLEAIGSDRYLAIEECREGSAQARQEAWALYASGFGRYCETRLDPLFQRLRHPARFVGRLEPHPAPVVVVGTGPSLAVALPDLRRLRQRLRIATSPRGAEALHAAGLVPDLVLVEHRTALDAHHSARHWRDGHDNPVRDVPLVAAEWRTPPSLIEGLGARVFVPDGLPTWGAWPATLAAMTLQAGATGVGLVGIDLGSGTAPDPAFAPMARLLGLIAQWSQVPTLDCGTLGAAKPHWTRAPLDELAASGPCPPFSAVLSPAPDAHSRRAAAWALLGRLEPTVARSRVLLDVAGRTRSQDAPMAIDGVAELLSWREDRFLRVDLQEGLGLSFLPRLWRSGVSTHLGDAAWRPVLLAAHELVGQADALAMELAA
ncbi:MAG TPA: 6-hydroxymethylpterin diphosphokinase MptE-like protein [Vicinamibacterales bacterium]